MTGIDAFVSEAIGSLSTDWLFEPEEWPRRRVRFPTVAMRVDTVPHEYRFFVRGLWRTLDLAWRCTERQKASG